VSARPLRRVWIGIDFSGNHLQWRDSRTATAVWIARIEETRRGPSLRDVRRVQDLPGDGPPFVRLVRFLQTAEFAVAGIDAPLAPPDGHFRGDRAALLAAVQSLPCGDRPFAAGGQLVRLLAPSLPPRGRHIHRATEQIWRRRGINVRSVLWNGPRGGAPFAAASLALVAACGLAVWPWADPKPGRVLAETFPAAQLKTWGLPYFGYNGASREARGHRGTIIEALRKRMQLTVPARFTPLLERSADALDSVICALAARAVSSGDLAEPPGPTSGAEGWIAVHR
jgi:predicted nuclease with RNAse H fold